MDGFHSLKNTSIPVWKTYLYQLQLQAPKPRPIPCQKTLPNKPAYYGPEYHGMISRQESEQLIGNEDGNYLVRESINPPGSCTLAIRFNNETKNYKVYYDGAFYVGEKRFDNINDLVHDGLISFYIEKHASNYIAMMAEENNYAESPYVASRTALLARQKQSQSIVDQFASHTNPHQQQQQQQHQQQLQQQHHQLHQQQQQQQSQQQRTSPQSIHMSFQRQHQLMGQPQQQQQQNHQPTPAPSLPSSSQQHHHQQQQPNANNQNHHHFSHQQPTLTGAHQLFQQSMAETASHSNTISQLDKENRHIFNTNEFNNKLHLIGANSSAKSNAIFDRFDIMNSEKQHRFKSQNFKGPHWCDFCLNFMWGLVSQGVKCQDCGFQAHKKCSERTPPDCEPQMRFIKRVFGVDLTTLVKATNSIRPIIVEKCIEEIERRKGAIECEGLYRVSGFSDAVEELKLAFDRGDNVDFAEFKYNDIHIICSLLKLYLRQLPIPLITFDVYNRLIESLNIANPKTNVIDIIKACVVELPPAHYLTLKYLMEHLVKVSHYSSKNQMNYENLAIVFGPTLMRSINPDPVLALKNTHKEQKITELLIANYTNIFEK